jgi:DNA-directed RNA polymerase subunit F
MVKPQLISEAPISMAELKAKLAEIKKRDSELNFRATKTEDYLNQITDSILSADKTEHLKKKLDELQIPRLKPEHITKIVDILPTTEEQLKLILQGYILSLSAANLKKVVEVVNEYVGQKK